MNQSSVARRHHARLVYLIFFLSGVAGLIYESIWTHYLKLFLGHAAYAQTLVLAIFMGGMAMGAAICSRFSVGWRNLFVAYAMVEGILAVGAFAFHSLFVTTLNFSHSTVIPRLDSVATVQLYKWGISILLVLPQSILLGMTFPLISAGLVRLAPELRGRSIAMLYFSNSLGGAVGLLLSGFLTIKLVGLNGTVLLAGILNAMLAASVWFLFRRSDMPAIRSTSTTSRPRYRSGIHVMLIMVSLVTGLASFIYEVGWIRMLSMVLGSSTHAFEVMLSAFILGLALGSLWIRGRITKISSPASYLGWVQILMGLAAVMTLPIYGQTFPIMQWVMESLPRTEEGYVLFNIASHGIAMTVMFPPAFLAGMTLPLITYALLQEGVGEKAIGAVYSANTVGAIIGVTIATHLLMPQVGLKGLILVGGVLDVGLGVLLVNVYRSGQERYSGLRVVYLGVALLLLVATAVFTELSPHKMASGIYRAGHLLDDRVSVVSHQDGKTATVSVTSTPEQYFSIRTNGKSDASIGMKGSPRPSYDEVTMTLTAAIPLLLHPEARKVANIGFGSGMTSHVLLADRDLTRVDNVEIEGAILSSARHFYPLNARAYDDPRSRFYREDAKTFFSYGKETYDLIISEPSNPWVSGVAGLFSKEFYQHVGGHLAPNGILAQWLQIYEFETDLLLSVLASVGSAFADYQVFALNHGDLLIVASNAEINIGAMGFPVEGDLAAALRRVDVNTDEDLRFRVIGSKASLMPLLRGKNIPLNSDYHPFLDQNAAQARFFNQTAGDILFPMHYPLPLMQLLGLREYLDTDRLTVSELSRLHFPVYAARYLKERLVNRKRPGLRSAPRAPEYRDLERRFDGLARDCENLPDHGDKVFVLNKIALGILSYLDREGQAEVWARVRRMECGSGLTRNEALWLEMYEAFSLGRTGEMGELASMLLKENRGLTHSREKLLIGVVLATMLGRQDHSAVHNFVGEYRSQLDSYAADDIAFEYLQNLANSIDG